MFGKFSFINPVTVSGTKSKFHHILPIPILRSLKRFLLGARIFYTLHNKHSVKYLVSIYFSQDEVIVNAQLRLKTQHKILQRQLVYGCFNFCLKENTYLFTIIIHKMLNGVGLIVN